MIEISQSLLKVDMSRVPAKVLKGIKEGTMFISSSNGVVYHAKGGIAAHLPLVPVSEDELASAKQLLQIGQAVEGAKATALAATAVSTVVVVAVVLSATAYITRKIDKVDRAVRALSQLVGQQDRREYLKHVTEYSGAVRAAQELLNARAPASETHALIVKRIDRLAELRQQTLQYVRGLSQIAIDLPETDQKHYTHVLRFMMEMLDLVPIALAVERELCLMAGMVSIAQSRRNQSATEFRHEMTTFREWCEDQFQELALGRGRFVDTLLGQENDLRALFNSPLHEILLNGIEGSHVASNPLFEAGAEPQLDKTQNRAH